MSSNRGGATSSEEPHPTELSSSAQGYGLELGPTRLSVRYIASGTNQSNDVGAIQANRPIPNRQLLYYFEITVLDRGEMGKIAIGYSDKGFRCTKQPGWEPGSYGYHGDDGHKFGGSGKGEEYGPLFGTGDTVGAGVNLSKQEMFFTKNGVMLKTAFRNVRGCLIPTLGLHSKGESVEVNFGQAPFKFDIEGLVADERAAKQEAIERMSIDSDAAFQMIRNYLLHYGYADTLMALDEDVGDGPSSSSSMMLVDSVSDEGYALKLRKDVRSAISTGDIDVAMALMVDKYPQLLKDQIVPVQGSCEETLPTDSHTSSPVDQKETSTSSCSSTDTAIAEVWFQLYTQQYIELLRLGKLLEAVQYAQSTLSHLRSANFQSLDAELRDVVALIAYERPEESPLAHLLSNQRRESVADAANSILLKLAHDATPSQQSVAHLQSPVERFLQQLVVVHDSSLEHNGGQGEPFELQQHLAFHAH